MLLFERILSNKIIDDIGKSSDIENDNCWNNTDFVSIEL